MTEGASPPPSTIDANPSRRARSPRLPGLDVTRAVALIGVVVMNYHGYLNGGDDGIDRSLAERIFDPCDGPLSTRFAATFVLVAGMGVTLMTNRSRLVGRQARDPSPIAGVCCVVGCSCTRSASLIEWIWRGTILFFYGAFFMIAALLFTLRIRWLVVIGAVAATRRRRPSPGSASSADRRPRRRPGSNPPLTSPRNLLLRTFVGLHPPAAAMARVLLCRHHPRPLPPADRRSLRPRAGRVGLVLFVGGYLVNYIGIRAVTDDFHARTTSATRWRESAVDRTRSIAGCCTRSCTLGSSLVAFCVISWIADRFPNAAGPHSCCSHAGQMTLTLYIAAT